MKARDRFDFLLLGAVWGGAFPLMRIAAPAFGPVPLAAVRVGVAAVLLVALAKGIGRVRRSAGPLLLLGLLNTAVPFVLFSYAMLGITAGLGSLLNATTPIFGALIAWLWLGERLTVLRVFGIALSFAGVGVIVWGSSGAHGAATPLGVVAALAGALSYGLAASFARRLITQDAVAVAAGSVCGAALALLPFAILQWPAQNPGLGAWAAALALGLVCTAIPYVIYFRLLDRVGVSRTVTVGFLIPPFGILWGVVFLDEAVTPWLLASCATVLAGTALASGWVQGTFARRA